jgi:hypothetical protein
MKPNEGRFAWYKAYSPVRIGLIFGIIWILELGLTIYMVAGLHPVMLLFVFMVPMGMWLGSQSSAKRMFKVGVYGAAYIVVMVAVLVLPQLLFKA